MTKLNAFEWGHEFEYDYVEDADILEVFFVRGKATSAVDIADDVTLRFDQENHQAMSLIINNYSYLVEPAQFGPRNFRLKLEHLPESRQEMVLRMISHPPVSHFIRMFTYTTSPGQQAIPIAGLEPSLT